MSSLSLIVWRRRRAQSAVLHHVAVLGERRAMVAFCSGEQHRHALFAVEPAHDLEDLGTSMGPAHRRLVEQHELRAGP
jgi:hypothetical protein